MAEENQQTNLRNTIPSRVNGYETDHWCVEEAKKEWTNEWWKIKETNKRVTTYRTYGMNYKSFPGSV